MFFSNYAGHTEGYAVTFAGVKKQTSDQLLLGLLEA